MGINTRRVITPNIDIFVVNQKGVQAKKIGPIWEMPTTKAITSFFLSHCSRLLYYSGKHRFLICFTMFTYPTRKNNDERQWYWDKDTRDNYWVGAAPRRSSDGGGGGGGFDGSADLRSRHQGQKHAPKTKDRALGVSKWKRARANIS